MKRGRRPSSFRVGDFVRAVNGPREGHRAEVVTKVRNFGAGLLWDDSVDNGFVNDDEGTKFTAESAAKC